MVIQFSNKNDIIRKKYVELLNQIIDNIKISKIIEKSIYNYCINLSKEKNITRCWNNIIFKKASNISIKQNSDASIWVMLEAERRRVQSKFTSKRKKLLLLDVFFKASNNSFLKI